jgi:cytochrome d ubiquinol oxidase subunit I
VTYWTFRFMIGIGMFGAVIAVWAWWRIRKGKGVSGRLAWWAGHHRAVHGLLGNSFGWIFTEMGRQPWIVFGLMPTAAGVSPGVSAFRGRADLDDRVHAALRPARPSSRSSCC